MRDVYLPDNHSSRLLGDADYQPIVHEYKGRQVQLPAMFTKNAKMFGMIALVVTLEILMFANIINQPKLRDYQVATSINPA